MNVGAADAISRVAAIQQMATALTGGGQTGFSDALTAAQSTSGTAAATVSGDVTGVPYATEINAAAKKYGIEPSLLAGLVKQESGFNPNATSGAGAKGLTQLMPATAKSLGVTDPTNPAQALDGGAKYLKQQLDKFGGDPRLALAAYNAGPGAVTRFGGVPPYAETQNYVKVVMANRDAYAKTAIPSTTDVSALTGAPSVSTGGLSTSLAALDTTTGTADSDSSNLSLSTSSSSVGSGTSSSLGYPTT